MKFKKLLLLPVLVMVIFICGCNISLYIPGNTPSNENNTPTTTDINLINPSNYQGTIKYAPNNQQKLSSEEVYSKGVTSTVYILATRGTSISGGSGVFFSEDNTNDGYAYLFTNAHVVEGANNIEIVYSNYKRDTATIVGYHTLEDVAVLAVKKNTNYTIATVNTNNISIGMEVVAIGTPVSTEYSFTATKGIISKIDSPITSAKDNSYQLLLLQTDATLNQGNSGGPLVDIYGNVIGLNTMKLVYDNTYTNIDNFNFSIPIERAIFMANKFFTNTEYHKGLIGVNVIDITDMSIASRNSLNISLDYGLYIDSLVEAGAAYNILQENDIITKINNIEFKTKIQFQKELYKYNKQETITLTVFRNNTYQNLNITLH